MANTAVVLASHGSPMVTIDLSVTVPKAVAKAMGLDDTKLLKVDEKKAKKAGKGGADADAPPLAGPGGLAVASSAPSGDSEGGLLIRKSMLRARDEKAAQTLERMRMLFAPKPPKGVRATREELVRRAPTAELYTALGARVDEQLPNSDAWKTAAVLKLGDVDVLINYNLPTITQIVPPSVMYAGVPAVCSAIKMLFTRRSDLVYQWQLLESNRGSTATTAQGTTRADAADPDARTTVCTDLVIIPKKEWVGKRLVFRARPNIPKALWTEVDTPPVVAPSEGFHSPPRWAKLQPHPATKSATSQDIRVVTYNILHDAFATSTFAKSKLYPFCTDATLDLKYRRARIMQEVGQYDGDVVCLQECGKDVFYKYYHDVLKSLGYHARLTLKGGQGKEGGVIAFKRSRFWRVELTELMLNFWTLKKEEPALAAEIEEKFPHLLETLLNVPSSGAVAVLFDKVRKEYVVVANTHLFYHPDGCHVRTLQSFMLARAVDRMVKKYETMPDPTKTNAASIEKAEEDSAAEQSDSEALEGLNSSVVPDEVLAAATPAATPDATTSAEINGDGTTTTTSPMADAAADATNVEDAPKRFVRSIVCGDFNATKDTGSYKLMTTGSVPADYVTNCWEKGLLHWWGCDSGLGAETAQSEVSDDEEFEGLRGSAKQLKGGRGGKKSGKHGFRHGQNQPAASESAEPVADAAAAEKEVAIENENENVAPATTTTDESTTCGSGDDESSTVVSSPASAWIKDPQLLKKTTSASPPTAYFSADLKLDRVHQESQVGPQAAPYTNYAFAFKEAIDHVFVSDGLKVDWALPVPPVEELQENVALPSPSYPSDHLAVVVDISHTEI